MKAENFEERKKGFQRFTFLYLASLVLVVAGLYALTGGEASPAEAKAPVAPAQDKALIASLRSDLDSARRQVLRLQKTLRTKDSLISMLAGKPILDGTDSIEEKDFIARLHKEEVNGDQGIQQLRDENAGLQLRLSEQAGAGVALKEQVSNLQQANEALRVRLKDPDGQGGQGDAGRTAIAGPPAGNTVDLLNAELRLAEVNCELSRADARQVVYNSRQRQELLTDALSILTQLEQSPDAEIQKKARQKMVELRSIVSTVHD
jgi:hypothetical protein